MQFKCGDSVSYQGRVAKVIGKCYGHAFDATIGRRYDLLMNDLEYIKSVEEAELNTAGEDEMEEAPLKLVKG